MDRRSDLPGSGGLRLRRDDLQHSRHDAKSKRCFDDADLAAGGNMHALAPRLDLDVLRANRVEVPRLIKTAEQGPQCQSNEAQTPRAIRDVEAELTAVQTCARANPESLHLISIIADEDKRRAPCQPFAVDVKKHLHERIAPQDRERRPDGRGPFAAAEPLLLQVTCFHQLRVNAQAGIVEEEVIVDRTHVDLRAIAFGNSPHRTFNIERDMKVLGEMIECPERQNAQRSPASDQKPCRSVQRSIAAADDDRTWLAQDRGADFLENVLSRRRELDLDLDSRRLEEPLHLYVSGFVGVSRSVDDDAYGWRHDPNCRRRRPYLTPRAGYSATRQHRTTATQYPRQYRPLHRSGSEDRDRRG